MQWAQPGVAANAVQQGTGTLRRLIDRGMITEASAKRRELLEVVWGL